MKEFLVGLLVVAVALILMVAGTLLFPLLLLLGLFLRFLVGIFILLFVIWAVGKLTLLAIEHLRNNGQNR